jgi:hypothetical protein
VNPVFVAAHEDHSAAEKADPDRDRLDDAYGVGLEALGAGRNLGDRQLADGGVQCRRDSDQHVGPEAGGLPGVFALPAQHGRQGARDQET